VDWNHSSNKAALEASVKIAAVQFNIAWEDRVANHKRVLEMLTASKPDPGSLIVLPELFDTGFSLDLVKTLQTDACESELFCQDIAVEYECCVIGGVVGRGITPKSSNEAFCCGPDGVELARYRKMRPFTLAGEEKVYPAGPSPAVFDFGDVKISPFICYDLRFPEIFRPSAREGAEVMVVLANWPAVRISHWTALLKARAIENQCAMVGVNRCGSDPNHEYDGKSIIINHMGETVAEAKGKERILTGEIDIDAIRAWREEFPALHTARTLFDEYKLKQAQGQTDTPSPSNNNQDMADKVKIEDSSVAPSLEDAD
jgi:omega-amidase